MTTQEIADRLVDLCRKGEYETCYQELYSPEIVSIEPEHAPGPSIVHGLEGIAEKGKKWKEMTEEFHGSSVGDPIVSGNHFSCAMMVDVTFKGQGRMKMEEICVYTVKDGKVVSEQFFY